MTNIKEEFVKEEVILDSFRVKEVKSYVFYYFIKYMELNS